MQIIIYTPESSHSDAIAAKMFCKQHNVDHQEYEIGTPGLNEAQREEIALAAGSLAGVVIKVGDEYLTGFDSVQLSTKLGL